VTYITGLQVNSGDSEPRLAAVRRREALDAFASLGVNADHVIFLYLPSLVIQHRIRRPWLDAA